MAKNKTTQTGNSVAAYVNAVKDEKKRSDCVEIIKLITKKTALEPKMWGIGIVGFGIYHYKNESGHEGDAPLIGIAARATAIVLYLTAGFDQRETLLKQFGKHKTGKGCIYIQKLEDIDIKILEKMIDSSVEYTKIHNDLKWSSS